MRAPLVLRVSKLACFACALATALLFADRIVAGFVQCGSTDACPWSATSAHAEQPVPSASRGGVSRYPW